MLISVQAYILYTEIHLLVFWIVIRHCAFIGAMGGRSVAAHATSQSQRLPTKWRYLSVTKGSHKMNRYEWTGEDICFFLTWMTERGTCPANTHFYNFCTTTAKCLRSWSNVVQMFYKCFVFTGYLQAPILQACSYTISWKWDIVNNEWCT